MKKIIILLLIPFILASCVLEVEDPNGLISQNVTNLTQNFNSSVVNNIINQTTNITNNITNTTTNNITNNISNTVILNGENYAYLNDNYFFSDTTLRNITNGTTLSFNYSAGDLVYFDVVLFGNWHSTPNIRTRIETGGNAIGKVTTYNVEQASDRLDNLDVTQASISVATGNDHVAMRGFLNATNDGSATVQIRQDTADTNRQRIDKGSYIKWQKITDTGNTILEDIGIETSELKIKEGLAPQSEVVAGNRIGHIEWYNNTFFFTDYKVRRTLVRGQDVLIENTTVANTVTQTNIFNLAHGENYLIGGKMEEIYLQGLLSSTTGIGSNTLNISFWYANNYIGSLLLTEANRNAENIIINALLTVRTTGLTGTMLLHGNIETETDGSLGYINEFVTIDTTTQENLTITAEWSDANPSNSLTILQGRALSIDDNQWT